ncbi:MAG: sialate O-acetylesterase [Clostridia bacterium]|nr:sialate O-acetylesterase [Clostridia bacterium]
MLKAFIMAGQSNMAGRGIIGDVPPIEHERRIFMLRNGNWRPMSEPINPDTAIYVDDRTKIRSGISPAASFAKAWTEDNEGSIGLIPCAYGGSSVDQWQPGTVLYDNMLQLARLAARSPAEICGVLWHQGENDSLTLEDALSHKSKLEHMISALRTELANPALPFIMGELAENHDMWPYTAVVNKGMHALCAETGFAGIASSSGYSIGPDRLHFTAEFCREFGKRYYSVYKAVLEDAAKQRSVDCNAM